MKLNVIILAAGKGSRMSHKEKNTSKVAIPLLGEPIVSYVINAVKQIKPTKIITIVGYGAEITKSIVGKDSICVLQKEQKGTGHAVMTAKKYISKSDKDYTLVLCGDAPLIKGETLKKLLNFHIKNKNAQSILSAKVKNPFGYGRIVRDKNNKLIKVVEETDASKIEAKINEVNSGVVMFTNKYLLKFLPKLTNNNKKKEYYLTQLISIFLKNNLKVDAIVMDDPHDMDGINTRQQLHFASMRMQKRINQYHIDRGVKILDSKKTYIGPNVKIGKNVTIKPNVNIYGKTTIADNVTIKSGVCLKDEKVKE